MEFQKSKSALAFLLVISALFSLTSAIVINGTDFPDPAVGLRPLNSKGRATIYYVSTFKTNSYDAELYCRASGRRLLAIETDVENGQLQRYLSQNPALDGSLWTSGNDINTEGVFVWSSTGGRLFYNEFVTDDIGYANDELYDCVSINPVEPYKWKWFIEVCGDIKNFICESNV